jgi:hypothetical protein
MRFLSRLWFVVLILPVACLSGQPFDSFEVWATRKYGSWENPLHSELRINGRRVNLFSSERNEPIGMLLREGWNTIAIRTTPQEPAKRDNDLLFQIGPVRRNREGQMVMSPVFWQFRNGTDWKLHDGRYTHAAGPNLKEIELSFSVYLGDLLQENTEIAPGDYVAQGRPQYASWNNRLTATVVVNGTIVSSFLGVERRARITPYLKPGRNEVRLITGRVKNSFAGNDIRIDVAGPAEWVPQNSRFEYRPVLQLDGLQGWTVQPGSGMLMNRSVPEADTLERAVSFLLKTL